MVWRGALERVGSGRLWIVACLLFAAHVAMTSYVLHPALVFSPKPLRGDDYDTHIGQTFRFIEAMRDYGQPWSYSPSLLAGHPAGVIFDGDNKGWAVFAYVLTELGLPQGMAFNLFVLVAHLCVPLVVFAAARVFELKPAVAVTAGTLASLLWFFDSFCHWVFWVGMVAWGVASYSWLLPLAYFYRYLRDYRPSHGVACALTLGAQHVLHPYSFYLLAPPMATMYLRAARGMPRRRHLEVGAIAACCIAMSLWWLIPAFAHWHYILDSAYYGQTGPSFLVADFFNLLVSTSDTGVIGTRAGFRTLAFGFGVVGLFRMRQEQEPLRWPLGIASAVLFVLAYLGSYVPFASQVQPYRFVMPACFVATLPAAWLLHRLVRERTLRDLSPKLRPAMLVVSLIACQHLARDMMYFLPAFIPEVPPLFDGNKSPIKAMGYTKHYDYRHPRTPELRADSDEFVDWIQRVVRPNHRILVDMWTVGERIAWKTNIEVIGGFRLRNIDHSWANFFRHYDKRLVSEKEIERYLRTFAIDWVMLGQDRTDFEDAERVVKKVRRVYGRYLYRTKIRVNKVLRGGGRVSAATNRIEVRGSDPNQDLLLSYH